MRPWRSKYAKGGSECCICLHRKSDLPVNDPDQPAWLQAESGILFSSLS